MTSSDHLLGLIQSTPEIDLLLRSSFGFDIHRRHYGDGFRLASGAQLEVIAGESAGGEYFLCAEQNGRRPCPQPCRCVSSPSLTSSSGCTQPPRRPNRTTS
ncbi:hypothetical protein OG594_45155 [Streptomyces sp. NBC_01214]|uniref:hypothetical protein n=1 Tax=Streptomyces sp. NBC_01214 TaxID=2903777 RepID=UPI002257B14B|nr:hypothetical protein [Streptomyces sp. NBC_01214]MCX4808677.1 hypothetical protein [Streptomyces sp. NBC_01214]